MSDDMTAEEFRRRMADGSLSDEDAVRMAWAQARRGDVTELVFCSDSSGTHGPRSPIPE